MRYLKKLKRNIICFLYLFSYLEKKVNKNIEVMKRIRKNIFIIERKIDT